MRKIIISLFVASVINVNANEVNNERFNLLAKDVSSKDNIITALGNVVILSPSYYLSANKIIYDKNTEIIELFGDVLIIKNNILNTQSNYAKVDLKNDKIEQTPTFIYDGVLDLWLDSKETSKNKDIIKLSNSTISSCDCIDPDWSIKASSADYDTKNMWINSYNNSLYFKNIPVFYLPYFGFPTDTRRRTGLLLPTISYSKSEGISYHQPIFFASAKNYDFELIPQVRNLRGYGSYGYFRYADSANSILKIKTAYFKEKDSYQKKENLENSKHYGFDLNYERKNIFSKHKDHQDGIFTSVRYLNDIEYITLETSYKDEIEVDKKVESKFNYFYNMPSFYSGIYAKYYIDASKKTNDYTLQELPQIQLHSYNKELFINNLIYSLDLKYENFKRKKGLNASIYELNLPFSYNRSFLDEYLYFEIENKSIISKYLYDNSNLDYKDGNLIQNISSFKLGSDLLKPYKNFIHTLNLSLDYKIPKTLKKNGDLYNITVTKDEVLKYDELKAFPVLQKDKTITLSLNQSIYKKEGLKQFINHKMSQSIIYNSLDEAKFQDYENSLKINHPLGYISGKIIYNMQDKQIVETSFDNALKYDNFYINLGYHKTVKTQNRFYSRDDLESYRIATNYSFAKDYSIGYYENHNLKDKVKNKQGIKLSINDSCWNLDLKLEKEIIPRSRYVETLNGYDSKRQTMLFVTLMLKPIGGIVQKHKVKEDESR